MEEGQVPVAGESIEEAPQPKYGYNSKFSSRFKVKNILQKKIPSKEDLESLNKQAEPTVEETKTDRKSGKFGRYFLSCLLGLITLIIGLVFVILYLAGFWGTSGRFTKCLTVGENSVRVYFDGTRSYEQARQLCEKFDASAWSQNDFFDYEDFGNYCHDFCDQQGKCITHCVDPFDAESDDYEITSGCEVYCNEYGLNCIEDCSADSSDHTDDGEVKCTNFCNGKVCLVKCGSEGSGEGSGDGGLTPGFPPDKDGFYDSSGTYQLYSDYCDSVTRSFDVDQGICSVYCKKGSLMNYFTYETKNNLHCPADVYYSTTSAPPSFSLAPESRYKRTGQFNLASFINENLNEDVTAVEPETLVTIRSTKENNELLQTVNNYIFGDIWLGFRLNGYQGTYQQYDKDSQPTEIKQCSAMHSGYGDKGHIPGNWYHLSCKEKLSFVCELEDKKCSSFDLPIAANDL